MRLQIDLGELASAMEDHSFAFAWYLDTQTGRFEPVPRISSHEGYRWMARFAKTVEAPELRALLRMALDGKGAFGRFRRALSDHSEERQRWHRYHDERLRAELDEWLERLGIEPA